MVSEREKRVIQYASWVVGHPWRVIVICVAVVTLLGAGIKHIAMTADYRVFFSQDDPKLKAFEAFEATYSKMDTILFIVKANEDDIYTPNTLAALSKITEQAWQIPHAIRVDSVSNFQHTKAMGDELVVRDLVEQPEQLKPVDLDRLRILVDAEPALKGRLVANDSKAAGVVVTLQLPGDDHTEHIPQSVKIAREIAQGITASYPGIKVALTGLALMSHAQMEVIGKDLTTLVPLMFSVMVVILLVLLRSLTGTIVCLVVITFSVVPATGVMGWLGVQLNQASASAPIIIMTLAIADCVHILISTFQNMALGQAKKTAIIDSLNLNAQPVLLTSVTTVIGFLSLNFSDTQPFRELGNYSALGVLIAWALSMTLLPAMMAVLPLAPKRQTFEAKLMSRVGERVVRYHKQWLWLTGITALLIATMIPRLQVEDRYVEWFDKSTVFRQDTDFATQHLTGPYVVEFSLPSGSSGGIAATAYLEQLEDFSLWLQRQPEVVHVSVFTDTLKRLNRSLHGDDPSWYRLPDSRELAAQYMLLYELSLPYGLDLTNQLNIDKSASRITVTLDTITSRQLRQFAERSEAWLSENTSTGSTSTVTGIALIFAYIGQRNIESMLWGTAVAFILISGIITIALGDIRLGLLSLLSNTLPVLITFGLWAIFVGEIGIIASVITATSLGLIVDDTVHFLTNYRRAKQMQGCSKGNAVRFSFNHVGRALWVTTIILIAGFLVLTFSVFALNVQLGALTAMTLLSALILDFFLLPSLLLWLDKPSLTY